MNRSSAERLVSKLREVREDRGATAAEAASAREKIRRLEARFGPVAHQARPRTSPRARRGPVWTAPRSGPVFFDPSTGQAGPGVKVHSYRDRANWRIEIDL